MSNFIYFKALIILLGIVGSIFLVVWIFKKVKLHERFSIKSSSRIEIVETRRVDHNKSVSIINIDGVEFKCILAENYGFVLDGGEGRIRTYERARRADLQSAAFGHSATSPESTKKDYRTVKNKNQ